MNKLSQVHEDESQEKTIRPGWRSPVKPGKSAEPKPSQATKSSPRKRSARHHQRQKSQAKVTHGSRFELPARPDLAYREHSVEDYSDLFDDNDSIFSQRLGLKKVYLFYIQVRNTFD
jgi:hypothetical protein